MGLGNLLDVKLTKEGVINRTDTVVLIGISVDGIDPLVFPTKTINEGEGRCNVVDMLCSLSWTESSRVK